MQSQDMIVWIDDVVTPCIILERGVITHLATPPPYRFSRVGTMHESPPAGDLGGEAE